MRVECGDIAQLGQTEQDYHTGIVEEPLLFDGGFDIGDLLAPADSACAPPPATGAGAGDAGCFLATFDSYRDEASWRRREAKSFEAKPFEACSVKSFESSFEVQSIEVGKVAVHSFAPCSFITEDGFEDHPLLPRTEAATELAAAAGSGAAVPASSAEGMVQPCPVPVHSVGGLAPALVAVPCTLPVWDAGQPLPHPRGPAGPPGRPSADERRVSAAELDAVAQEYAAMAWQLQAAADEVRRVAGEGDVRTGVVGLPVLPCLGVGAMHPDANREEPLTTVMLRNLPNDYSRKLFLDLLDQEGFAACYDFIYLPVDFKRKAGLGYAFVNLVDTQTAERFIAHFDGFCKWRFASQKVCSAAWGKPLQGLAQHIEHYRNSPLMHDSVPDEFKPVLFREGVRVDFPQPLKRIRPPRVKFQLTCSGA